MSKSKHRALRFVWGLIPWLLVAALGMLLIFLGGRIQNEQLRLAEAKQKAMRTEIPAVRIITLTLAPRPMADIISLPAEVEAGEDLWVKAEVPGQVVAISAREGSLVRKGEMLVQIDERDYRARLDRIEANYRLAQVDHDRIASLVKRNIMARSKLDEVEARLKDLAAQLSEARLALSRTRIKAPISGLLNEVRAKHGDFLPVNEPVAQILQLDPVKIRVGVPESDVSAVLDLQEADVILEALGGRRLRARKVLLARQPRSMARLFDLELELANPEGRILPGMFARVELTKAVYPQAVAVPLYAVITQGEERYVYVEQDGRAVKRPVELGFLSGWQVQVTGGLKPGERVVVVGHRLLDDGQSVEVIKNVNRPEEISAS